jgi:hypothetical protein
MVQPRDHAAPPMAKSDLDSAMKRENVRPALLVFF